MTSESAGELASPEILIPSGVMTGPKNVDFKHSLQGGSKFSPSLGTSELLFLF